MTLKIRTQYEPREKGKYATKTTKPSLTQQQFKEECNVNNILAKYKKTGLITHLSKHQGNFGDFSSVDDYQTALQKVQEANDNFQLLPSELRNKFNNDPSKLIEFIRNPENQKDAIKYGLIVPRKVETPIEESFEKALDNHYKKTQPKTEK